MPKKTSILSFLFLIAAQGLLFMACGGGGGGSGAAVDPPPPANSTQVSQFGITWTLDNAYETGQFANGDYWVVGPATIIGISPASTVSGTRTINGSMLNPSPREGNVQGYDSAMYANTYAPELNVARPNQRAVSTANPLIVPVNSSIVSTVSIAPGNNRPQLKTAAILTVLATRPLEGSFRPPYSGSDKTIRYNASQLDYSLLKSLAPVASTPVMADVERYFERPWIDHIPNWSAGYQHPEDNMPNYGRDMAAQVATGALMLQLNFSNEAKRTLLIRYVQLGIDLFGIVQDGGINNWAPNGGHSSGRKWPILFAGLVLNDADMKNIGHRSEVVFGEDAMTFYVTKHPNPASVWSFNGSYWVSDGTDEKYDIFVPNPKPALDPIPTDFNAAGYRRHEGWGFTYYGHANANKEQDFAEYTDANEGLPDWEIGRGLGGLDWNAAYRNCGNGDIYGGYILAANMMPGARALWNHEALFDYTDRFMAIEGQSPFVMSLWQTYRADYGCIWTRDAATDTYSNGKPVCR